MELGRMLDAVTKGGFAIVQNNPTKIAVKRDDVTINLGLQIDRQDKIKVLSIDGAAQTHFPKEMLNKDIVELSNILLRYKHEITVEGGQLEIHDTKGEVGTLTLELTNGQYTVIARTEDHDLAAVLRTQGIPFDRPFSPTLTGWDLG